ncbi:hypothetical protein JTB14_008773 [Gonioctena quinquepunctata]|nr:hypothetical protein JTB14_008773 [Gonioctena quinquepunctata]
MRLLMKLDKLENKGATRYVLNYPDPDRRILQNNQEDWFFLATKNYLGDIEKLEIWFDSAGLIASWHCSDIMVVDIKTGKCWWFNIKYRFEISTTEKYIITPTPEGEKNNRKCSLERFSFQGNHFWDLHRQGEITFSKCRRLTIMLSIFMTTYTTILFLYGSPELRYSDSLDPYLEYGFYVQLIWASIGGLAITFLLHLPIVHFFRYPRKGIICENNKIGTTIHISSDMICWYFLVFLLLFSMTGLLILGFWVPHVTALLWLTSVVASLLIYIFLLENIIRLVNNFTMSKTRRIAQIHSRVKPVMDYIDAQRVFIMEKTGYESLRPYFELLYSPTSQSRMKEQKFWAQMRAGLLRIVQDVIMISVYIVLLYTLVLKNKDPMTRISNQEVIDLMSGIHSRTIHPRQVISKDEALENYIRNTLIFSLQSSQWYGKFLSKDPGMTIDNNNKYIGIARLRQHRSNNHSCVVYPSMRFLTEHCISPYANGPEFKDFSEGWGNNTQSDKFARMDSIWKYKKPQITGTSDYSGAFATYNGGGYVTTLGRNWKNSLLNIQYIYRNNWIDRYTRCLFIEFLMYSPNSNLFQSVLVTFELGTSGYDIPMLNVRTARLLFTEYVTSVVLLVLLTLIVLMVCILSAKLIPRREEEENLVIRDLWILADIIMISLSIAFMFIFLKGSYMYQFYKKAVAMKINKLRQRGGQDDFPMGKKPVSAKAKKHRYAKGLKVPRSKIDTMWFITRGILRNMKYHEKLTEQDRDLMKKIIATTIRNNTQKDDIFFVHSSRNKKPIFLDDYVLKNMEKILIILLTKQNVKEDKILENNSRTIRKIGDNLLNASVLLNKIVNL